MSRFPIHREEMPMFHRIPPHRGHAQPRRQLLLSLGLLGGLLAVGSSAIRHPAAAGGLADPIVIPPATVVIPTYTDPGSWPTATPGSPTATARPGTPGTMTATGTPAPPVPTVPSP